MSYFEKNNVAKAEIMINENNISSRLMKLIEDTPEKYEFIYDFKLKKGSDSITSQILSDKKLFKIILNSIKMDCENDMEMEKDSGEDIYIIPLYNEIVALLNVLDSVH